MGNAAAIIREARNVLFERGWCQGVLEDDSGRVCAAGAVNFAEHGFSSWSENCEATVDPVLRLLSEAADGSGVMGIVMFNNARGRTFAEMIDVFDTAEKLAEANV